MTKPFLITLTERQEQYIKDYQAKYAIPSRAEAIRRLFDEMISKEGDK